MEWCPMCQASRNVVEMRLGPLAVLHTCEHCRVTLRMSDAETDSPIGASLADELGASSRTWKGRDEPDAG